MLHQFSEAERAAVDVLLQVVSPRSRLVLELTMRELISLAKRCSDRGARFATQNRGVVQMISANGQVFQLANTNLQTQFANPAWIMDAIEFGSEPQH